MNTDYYLICLVIAASGYFWGKIINKYFPALKQVNTTAFGMFAIFGLFQILVFYGIPAGINAEIYRIWLLVILAAGPLLCLILWVNVLPNWNDLFAFILGAGISALLVYYSMPLNTNNMFFDSVFYLSKVIDSSTDSILAHVNCFDGQVLSRISSLYDYQGYYYFWGMVLKQYRMITGFSRTLTPVYIWCGTMTYGLTLGYTIASGIQILLPKISWKHFFCSLLIIAFLLPYYTNYFNTALGFFGNTIKTAAVGAAVMTAFLLLRERQNRYVILLAVVYLAGLSFSSSCFFQFAFLSIAVFFCVIIWKTQDHSFYPAFLAANLPLVWYFYVLGTGWEKNLGNLTYYVIFAYLVIFGLSFLLRFLPEKADKVLRIIGMVLYGALLCVLLYVSYLNRNGEMGYSYFFAIISKDNMTLNYTSWLNETELYRNAILWVLLAVSLINFRKNTSFKILMAACIVLFINPLVCPALANYATDVVYNRVFELIVNPFVLTLLAAEFMDMELWYLTIPSMALVSCFSGYLAYENYVVPYAAGMLKNSEGYDWTTKVTTDQLDIYNYLMLNGISNSEDRPSILSQDISLKAYVPDVSLYFSSIDIRAHEADGSDLDFSSTEGRLLVDLYPTRVYTQDIAFGHSGDYKNFADLVKQTNADYVIMRPTMSLYDARGWYYTVYSLLTDSLYDKVYENSSYVVLKAKK